MDSTTGMSQAETVSWLSCRVTLKEKIPLVLGVLCVAVGLVFLFVLFVVFKPCDQCDSSIEQRGGGVAIIVVLVGGITLLVRYKRQQALALRPPDVVVSEIPAEDVEKSPAAVISLDHIPHRLPVLHEIENEILSTDLNSTEDLPDYYTAVRKLQYEVNSSDSEDSQSSDLPGYFSAVVNRNFSIQDEMDFSATNAEDNLDSLVSRDGSLDTRL